VRLESNVAPRILTVSESWITESSNLTEERLDMDYTGHTHTPLFSTAFLATMFPPLTSSGCT